MILSLKHSENMMSIYLVSQSFKSPFANVKINLLLSVNKICNIICAGMTHLISSEESYHLRGNSFETNASELWGRWGKAWMHRPGRELTGLFASQLSLQTWGHLISHKLKVTTWAQRSHASVKQDGYQKTPPQKHWLLRSVKLREDKTIWTPAKSIFSGHILKLLFSLEYHKELYC